MGVTEGSAPRPKRWSFDAAFKARVLAECEALTAFLSQRWALLRREGLCASHIAHWRAVACKTALTASVRASAKTPADRERRACQRIAVLDAELARPRLALEIRGRAHAYAGDRCQVKVLVRLSGCC